MRMNDDNLRLKQDMEKLLDKMDELAATARVCFDLAVASLDFASGFWDTEETGQMRHLARLLGIDPELATPRTHEGYFKEHPDE